MRLETFEMATPAGDITVAVSDDAIHALGFTDHWAGLARRLAARYRELELVPAGVNRSIADHIDRYFHDGCDALGELAVCTRGTPFQQQVWKALRGIAPGKTVSYQALAKAIGFPKAARAVGAACNANPVWLVIPCHRVISASGDLVGYAGGIERKRWLLDHEATAVRAGCLEAS